VVVWFTTPRCSRMGGYQITLRYTASIFRVELKMDTHLLS